MILALRQTHTSMKQYRENRIKPTYTLSTDLQQKCQDYTMGKKYSLQLMALVKLDFHMQKNEIGSIILHHTQKSTQNG